MRISIRELRKETAKIVDYVEGHHHVILTKRGKPCAELIPFQTKRKKNKVKEADEAFGMWADHKAVKSVDAYIRQIRKGRFEDVD